MGINVLSLFDGCAGAFQALKHLKIGVNAYYACEIDPYAIQIAKNNHLEIIHLGDVTKVDFTQYKGVDLLIGGSPCTDLSVAKRNREGLAGANSNLFYEYVRALEEAKPKYFLLENVASMKSTERDKISEILGVQPIMINSALLTAQSRKRYYWTNIPNVIQPEDKGILLKDIIEDGFTERHKSLCVTAGYCHTCPNDYFLFGSRQMIFTKPVFLGGLDPTKKTHPQGERVYFIDGKSVTLSANGGGRGAKTGLYEMKQLVASELKPIVRRLTPVECERLQGFPDNYSEGVSNTQRYKMMGNGFTVPVISHILSFADWRVECIK